MFTVDLIEQSFFICAIISFLMIKGNVCTVKRMKPRAVGNPVGKTLL